MSGKVRHITTATEFAALLETAGRSKLVVVDFWATWCGPCRGIAPYFEELAVQFKYSCIFVKVDVDAGAELAAKYGVRSIPHFQFFLGGKRVDEFTGANQEALLEYTQRLSTGLEFAGVGHTLGGGDASTASSSSSSAAASTAASATTLPTPPEDRAPGDDETKVQFRLPDGRRLTGVFKKEDTVQQLVDFVKLYSGESSVTLTTAHPRKVLASDAYATTLKDANLLTASLVVGRG